VTAPTYRQLIIVRHAHRDKPKPLGSGADNGLSKKGKAQAKEVARFFLKFVKPSSPSAVKLLSSPKKRCVQTLDPLSAKLKCPIEILPALDEQGSSQSGEAFQKKIRTFFDAWEKGGNPITIICSHGDWIPLALKMLSGTSVDLKKGGWTQLNFENGNYQLTWILQKLVI